MVDVSDVGSESVEECITSRICFSSWVVAASEPVGGGEFRFEVIVNRLLSFSHITKGINPGGPESYLYQDFGLLP